MAVLAVDPSSPFSGGALLGDRVRMQQHALDPGVFIRSMATRGHLGGLAVAAPQAIRVLDAAGFDIVLVETVGVGQSEVEVAGQVDATLVLLAPGMGDGIQAAKAGMLEIGDLFVVNKSDRDGAQAVVRELRGHGRPGRAERRTPGSRRSWPPWRPGARGSPSCSTGSSGSGPPSRRTGTGPPVGSAGPAGRSSRWCWPGCRPSWRWTRPPVWTRSPRRSARGELDAYTAADRVRRAG